MKPSGGAPVHEVILPTGWRRPSGFSHGVRVPAGRDLLFVAGQVAFDERQEIVGRDLTSQFRQALANCVAVVRAAGGEPADIVRLTVYVTDRDAYREQLGGLGDAWRAVMGLHFPAMALFQVAALVEPAALVEIEATAALRPMGGTC